MNILEPAHYALRLQGKTLHDIQAADTLQMLYPLAAALDVIDCSHKKKHALKQEIIDKYNSVFCSIFKYSHERSHRRPEHPIRARHRSTVRLR